MNVGSRCWVQQKEEKKWEARKEMSPGGILIKWGSKRGNTFNEIQEFFLTISLLRVHTHKSR